MDDGHQSASSCRPDGVHPHGLLRHHGPWTATSPVVTAQTTDASMASVDSIDQGGLIKGEDLESEPFFTSDSLLLLKVRVIVNWAAC